VKAENSEFSVQETLRQGVRYLEENGIDEAKLLAERLLQGLLECRRYELYVDRDRTLTTEQFSRYQSFLGRRVEGIPAQYILGKAEFMDFTFSVNPSVLIPRPETEILVEKIVERYRPSVPAGGSLKILEIGTGSGNIAVSLASYLIKASLCAVDISDEALETARLNAMRNEVAHRIRFLRSDLFSAVPTGSLYDAVVSNPPYLSEKQIQEVPREVSFEPRSALFGGPEGTEVIEKIAADAGARLAEGGRLYMEIGAGQAARVGGILNRCGWGRIAVHRDYQGIDRVVEAQWKNS
jgi:release factor glutamine methyltransferase